MRYILLMIPMLLLTAGTPGEKKNKPTLYIIGDSTVKNGSGKGEGGLWGWGDFMYEQLDTTRITIKNLAIGGRSSRTFITDGRWDNIMKILKPGDYVIMQFGHNDGGAINDNSRARGTIRGTGEETEEIDNILTKKHEIVHTYGWYLRKYISDTKTKGAVPIVCSPIPRNDWKDGKVLRASADYGKWARESAETGSAFFIDLNEMIAARYEKTGEKEVTSKYFLNEHTHTTREGAILNASVVAEGIGSLEKCTLKKFLK
jgi:rhamnogalacturonan acetylesterase